MSKEFKLKVMAQLREPVRKTEDGSISCAMNVMIDRTCSHNDYLLFCCSLVNSLIQEADKRQQADLKEALSLICLMPEEFFLKSSTRVSVDAEQLRKECNGSNEE